MRIWATRFQVIKEMEAFPIPFEIVYEMQNSPSYHLEGKNRTFEEAAQIVCTISGEGVFRHQDNIFHLTPGKAFMAKLNNPDTAYYYPGNSHTPWYFLWISMNGPRSTNMVDELNKRYGYVFDLPLDRGFVKHLYAFESQRDTFQVVTPAEGGKIVMDAIAAFCESIEGNITETPQAKLTRSAQEFITANLNRDLDISNIAERLHVSREHLTRVFHSQTGKTPGRFATEERMRTAGRMLMNNHLTCKEIAERLGYDSASSFARAFKNYYALSPAEYKDPNQRRQLPREEKTRNASPQQCMYQARIDGETDSPEDAYCRRPE